MTTAAANAATKIQPNANGKGPQPAPNAKNPTAAPSAKPTAQGDGAKGQPASGDDEDSGRINHPLVGSKDPNVYPFKSVPGDFDPKVHKPLKKKDFVEEATYFDYRAEKSRQDVTRFERMAAEARAGGSTGDAKSAKRFTKMVSKIDELAALLKAKGVNVEELIAKAKAEGAKPADAAAKA